MRNLVAAACSSRSRLPPRRRGVRAGQARDLAGRQRRDRGRPAGRAEDLSADDPARRSRSHPDFRRRPGRRLHAAGARGARRPMRARDLLRDRPQGRGPAGARAARARRRPYDRASHLHPSPADPALHEPRSGARRHPARHGRRSSARSMARNSRTASRAISRNCISTRRSSAFPASPTPPISQTGSPPTMSGPSASTSGPRTGSG